MLHSLSHPNIVHCHGVAVMPPAICLVTEWCHHGSLYDLLHTSEYYIRNSSVGRPSTTSNKRSTSRPASQGRFSFNIRMSTQDNQSCDGDDTTQDISENINTISPVGEITENQDHGNGNLDRKSLSNAVSRSSFRVQSSQHLENRSSFSTSDLRVVSKKFQTTSRSSLSLKINLFDGNQPKIAEDFDDEATYCQEPDTIRKGIENGQGMY